MLAMAPRLDTLSFFFPPTLSLCIFSTLVFEVFRNRFSCHACSVAELSGSALSNFGHRSIVDRSCDLRGSCHREPLNSEASSGGGVCRTAAKQTRWPVLFL